MLIGPFSVGGAKEVETLYWVVCFRTIPWYGFSQAPCCEDYLSYHSAFKRAISPSRQDSSSATNGGPDFASEEPCRLHSLESEMVSLLGT